MQAARQFIDDTDAPSERGGDNDDDDGRDEADGTITTSVAVGFTADGANLTRAGEERRTTADVAPVRESSLRASEFAGGSGDAALGLVEMARGHPDDPAGGGSLTP